MSMIYGIRHYKNKIKNKMLNYVTMKITQELKFKFQDAINKTKDNGEEHGFYICEDNKGISSSKIIPGKDRRINLGDPVISCHGKKVRGNFHTHSYLTLFKQKSRFMKPARGKKKPFTLKWTTRNIG